MNTKKLLIMWHLFAFTYLLIFILLMGVFPEIETFSYLTKKYGFIDIENWDFYYLLFIALTALIVNNFFIIFSMKFIKRFNTNRK